MVEYKIVAILFDKSYTSDSARRLLTRFGVHHEHGGRLGDQTLRYPIDVETSAKRRNTINAGRYLFIEVGVKPDSMKTAPTNPNYVCLGILLKMKSSETARNLLSRLGIEESSILSGGRQESDGVRRYHLKQSDRAEYVSEVWVSPKLGFMIGIE